MTWYALKPGRRALLATIVASLLTLSAALVFAQDEKKPTPLAGPAQAVAPLTSGKVAPAAPAALSQQGTPQANTAVKKPVLSPMVAEMTALLASQDEKLAALAARQGKATTGDEALAVQREIQELKMGTEISLLRIQATYARRDGRVQAADKLDAAIRDLVSPPKLGTATTRPAPVRTEQPR